MHITVHPDRVAIVDPDDFAALPKRGWTLKVTRWGEYAQRVTQVNGKRIYTYMHRLIMETPKHLEVHHDNGYGLDNRRCNLCNITNSQHTDIRRMNRIAKKKPVN